VEVERQATLERKRLGARRGAGITGSWGPWRALVSAGIDPPGIGTRSKQGGENGHGLTGYRAVKTLTVAVAQAGGRACAQRRL
jgi:hypothetical protein